MQPILISTEKKFKSSLCAQNPARVVFRSVQNVGRPQKSECSVGIQSAIGQVTSLVIKIFHMKYNLTLWRPDHYFIRTQYLFLLKPPIYKEANLKY